MVTRKASKKAAKGSKGKASERKVASAPKAPKRKASAPKPNVNVQKKLVKDAPTDEQLTLPCTLAPIPLPADVRPCVVVAAEPDYAKIEELERQYPQGVPNWEIDRLSHKIQTCWQRQAGWVGKIYTAEWREKAVQRLKSLAASYEFAAEDYVYAPESERIHRTRLRELARILRATLSAHLLDNDTAREYLKTAANEARLFSEKLEGSKLRTFYGIFYNGTNAKHIEVHDCKPIDLMLLEVHEKLHEGAQRCNDSSRKTAESIARLLVIHHYDVFLDRLREPTKFEPNDQTVKKVATKIEPILDSLETNDWTALETAKNVVRAALRILRDKNPDDFFSNFDKGYKKHRAQKQDR